MNRYVLTTALAALAMCASSAVATAQSDTTDRPRPEPRQVLSIQPLQTILGVVSGDYEHAVGNGFTVGAGASYWDLGTIGINSEGAADASYFSAEGKVRYYPGELPFRGFSLGLTAGGSHASYRILDDSRESASGVKVGVEADYNWLLGRSDRLALALGIGAKRIWYGVRGHDLEGAYPTSRIAIGWAF